MKENHGSSRLLMFFKVSVLKNFTNYTGCFLDGSVILDGSYQPYF